MTRSRAEAPAIENATAIILAGGLGTRLRAAVADRPKVLADVAGRPFLAHLLDQLAEAGVRHTVLCTGYRGEQVREAMGRSWGAMELEYSHEREPLGTGGALRAALPLARSECVLALNGDSCCCADLREFWNWHQARSRCASLLAALVPDTARFGRLALAADGRVLRFMEKDGRTGPGWINAGIYLLNRNVLMPITTQKAVSLERDVLPAWAGRGLAARRTEGAFLDIGTPESYARAEEFFALSEQA